MDPLIVFFGLGVGILIGLTGVGGGSLMTPLLLLAGGCGPVVAIGTDIGYGAITKTLGGWRHLKKGTVDLGVSKWLAIGSVPGSLVGVALVNELHRKYGKGFDDALLISIAVALVIVAVTTLTRALFMPALVAREKDSVLITRGEHGMWLLGADGEFDLPADTREVSDVTGAGDTVIATMALGLAAGGSLRDSARLANRAAAATTRLMLYLHRCGSTQR